MMNNCGCRGYGQARTSGDITVEGFIDETFSSFDEAEAFRIDSIAYLTENGVTVQISTVQQAEDGYMVYFSLTGPAESRDVMPVLVNPFAPEETPKEKSAIPVILAVGATVGLLGILIAAVGKSEA